MFGIGNLVESFLDKVGAPEWLGDIGSGVANFFSGNWPALIGDGLDLLPNVAKGLGQDELAGVLEYADDAYSFASGGGLDKLLSGESDQILSLLGGMGEGQLKSKLGDTNNMLMLLKLLNPSGEGGTDVAGLFSQGGAPNAGALLSQEGGLSLANLLPLLKA
jgi:hypothetical protein